MKLKVHEECCRILTERIHSLQQQLRELVEGAKNDSKSTAGDKHETARAMMQIEQEKLSNQLNLLLQQEEVLKRIDSNAKSVVVINARLNDVVGQGSLVKTNQGWIYICIPLGKVVVEGESVMCLSSQSPLGMKMVGKKEGECVVVNNSTFVIESVT